MNQFESIVLMYHGTLIDKNQKPPAREVGAELYDVPIENFHEQMEFLHKHDFWVTMLEEIKSNSEAGSIKRTVLTFDDGELNNFSGAFQVLKEFEFPAYFFVTVNRIGRPGYMNWDKLKELHKCGMVIGSHGLNHEILTDLDDQQLEKELRDSKSSLEKILKTEIKYFSVPRGFWNERVVCTARDAGYKTIFVSGIPQESHPDCCIGRIPVMGSWSLKRFAQALNDRIPWNEAMVELIKTLSKRVLGSKGYDQLRSNLLKTKK